MMKPTGIELKEGSCDQSHSLMALLRTKILKASQPELMKTTDLEKGQPLSETESNEKKKSVMEPILTMYIEVKSRIRKIEMANEELREAIEKVNQVIDSNQKEEIVTSMTKVISSARNDAQQIKAKLVGVSGRDGLKKDLEQSTKKQEPGSIVVEIKKNLFNYYLQKYHKVQKIYSSLTNEFRRRVHNRAKREIGLWTQKKLDEDELDDLIERGRDKEFINAMLMGENQQTLERLMQRSNAVNQINTEVRNLLSMFQDMAALVEQQQETVDSITYHIESTKEYTGEAARELIAAANYRWAAQKKALICAILALIVLAVIIVIALAATGGFDSGDGN
eukprot:CAMPEP_0185251358 /NCGR_PEP_ID=MMETSP1359-20130426/769_1 /TAXON_ID=552665 /ORGANISM="Bigelowiella longifila, Strain CCMP242" /LENGTH=335 /DNA_ID=CAMNT_0027833213 /DNA_START=150 /DNA_END=1157 /DNA_ORIENTATION=+